MRESLDDLDEQAIWQEILKRQKQEDAAAAGTSSHAAATQPHAAAPPPPTTEAEPPAPAAVDVDAAQAAAAARLPPEPASCGCRVAFRLPDGGRVQRNFNSSDTVAALQVRRLGLYKVVFGAWRVRYGVCTMVLVLGVWNSMRDAWCVKQGASSVVCTRHSTGVGIVGHGRCDRKIVVLCQHVCASARMMRLHGLLMRPCAEPALKKSSSAKYGIRSQPAPVFVLPTCRTMWCQCPRRLQPCPALCCLKPGRVQQLLTQQPPLRQQAWLVLCWCADPAEPAGQSLPVLEHTQYDHGACTGWHLIRQAHFVTVVHMLCGCGTHGVC